jgi:peptide/nickel transport system substrate-binding protein
VLRQPLLALAILAAACGTAPRRGDTVLYASGADLASINPLLTLHPLARQVQRYVLLTTLARYDSALVPRPYLARDWSWSADRRILTFALRTDVRWHDGRPTTAQDVVWTLRAARDPATGYPRLGDLAALDSARALDDSTVALAFRTPQERFPDVLTDLAVLPAHLLGATPHAEIRRAAWNERPVGNGPFVFVSHEANRRWVFRANPDFPQALGGPPRLARFILVVVDEPTTKLAALTAGELDVAGIQPAHAAFVARDPDLRVLTYPLLLNYGIVLNRARPPFDRLDAREAVALAVNRTEIVEGYAFGFATAAGGPVPPEVPGAVPAAPQPYLPDSARALLGGHELRFELLTVGSGEAALEQLLQAELARAGIRITIRQMELSAFLARVYGRHPDFAAAVVGTSGDLGLGYLGPLAALGAPPAWVAPSDPAAIQRYFADSMPVAFLYHARGLQGLRRRVQGVRMDLRGELATVHDWWVSP